MQDRDKLAGSPASGAPVYRRIVIKMSGEALAGTQGFGLVHDVLESVALQVKTLSEAGVQVSITVGGGNIWRGVQGSQRGMERVRADHMGMLATCINALALQDALEANHVAARVMSAIEMRQIAQTYTQREAVRHLEKGRVVIFAAGIGNPFLTTDTTAAMRAAEIKADVVLKATNVDGVYDSDPAVNPGARKYETITYSEALRQGLKVMDAAAFSLCMENQIPILVFRLQEEDSIVRAAMGEKIGTSVGR